MSTGKRFKLTKPTLALELIEGKSVASYVPEEAVVEVLSGPMNIDRMVVVLWNGSVLLMFADDLHTRGIEVS
jgi:hypothetical protein